MKVPNDEVMRHWAALSLSRLQNEGSQRVADTGLGVCKSIKATDEGSQPTYVGMSQAI